MTEMRAAWLPRIRSGESPLRLSLAIGIPLGTAFLALEAALGRLPLVAADDHVRGDFRVACVLIVLVAYQVARS